MLISNPQMLTACVLLFVLFPSIHLFALKYYDTETLCMCVCVRACACTRMFVWWGGYEGVTLCSRCDK
jgi:hypothetical protein